MDRPRTLATRDLARVALFAALIAVLGLPGQLQLFGNAVPVTAQTLGVMLAGSLIGARLAFLSVATFLVLVAAGLPLLAGGRGGLGVFTGPSAGYLIGWLFGAAAIGAIVSWGARGRAGRPATAVVAIANVVGGIGVIYAIGIPVQSAILGTKTVVATAIAAGIYLPGDTIKVVIATAVAVGVHRAYPVEVGDRSGRATGGHVGTVIGD